MATGTGLSFVQELRRGLTPGNMEASLKSAVRLLVESHEPADEKTKSEIINLICDAFESNPKMAMIWAGVALRADHELPEAHRLTTLFKFGFWSEPVTMLGETGHVLRDLLTDRRTSFALHEREKLVHELLRGRLQHREITMYWAGEALRPICWPGSLSPREIRAVSNCLAEGLQDNSAAVRNRAAAQILKAAWEEAVRKNVDLNSGFCPATKLDGLLEQVVEAVRAKTIQTDTFAEGSRALLSFKDSRMAGYQPPSPTL